MRSIVEQHLIDQVRLEWQALSGRNGDASALESALSELYSEQRSSNGHLVFEAAEFQLLMDIGELSLQASHEEVFCSLVAVLHEAVVGEARRPGDQLEIGAISDLLCDYLDMLLVPLTLRQSALSEPAMQCPCQRCFKATQAVQQLRDSILLRKLATEEPAGEELTVLSFLRKALVHAGQIQDRLDGTHVMCVIELLAVLGICARLQDNANFLLPPRVVQTILTAVQDYCWTSGRQGDIFGPTLLRGLHLLRNVASNRAQVSELSSEALGNTSRRISQALDTLTSEDQSRPKSGVDRRSRRTRPGGGASSSLGLSPDSQVAAPAVLNPRSTWAQPSLTPRIGDGGNPQESDECTSGAEVGGLKMLAMRAGNALAQQTPGPSRCAELFVLYSLALQALAQSDEALHHALLSEEAIRWQMVVVVRMLRTMEVTPKWRDALAFHGIRLYVLVCRSSHIREKYAVLQQPFVEEERRAVAFLLSLTPPSQRCCVLLRAMSQDVHSWLLWQTQSGDSRPTQRLQARPRRRSKVSSRQSTEAAGAEAEVASELQACVANSAPSAASADFFEDAVEEQETCAKYLFTQGESVWLVHALLVLALVACLVAMWHSVETFRPRGPNVGRRSNNGL